MRSREPTPTEPCDVFISYRRQGGSDLAMLIRKSLQERGYRVFLDYEGLRSGQFPKDLLAKIEEATDFLAILTPGCLDRITKAHRKSKVPLSGLFSRDDDRDDWVRTEIAHAISLGKNVVPVLADRFELPRKRDLPPDVAALTEFNGFSPRSELFEQSIDRLCDKFLLATPSVPSAAAVPAAGHKAEGSLARTVPVSATAIDERAAEPKAPKPETPKPSPADERSAKLLIEKGIAAALKGDLVGAFRCYESAASLGSSDALISMAHCYWRGEGVAEDRRRAEEHYQRAADAGNVEAYGSWGNNLFRAGDPAAAEAVLKRGCDRGDLFALTYMGGLELHRGRPEEADQYFERAVRIGGGDTAFQIGLSLELGWIKIIPKSESFLKWYLRAAALGDGRSAARVGEAYQKGQGVPKNDTTALEWFHKAQDLGHAGACWDIGNAYRFGRGVDKNLGKAFEWYRKGAELGHALSMDAVADRYLYGEGVPKDANEAIAWYRKALKAGWEPAADSLKRLGASAEE